jgi:all-trans-retinol dehydrogenase (NAD+)
MTTLPGMYNQMSPTFGAADALLRDYESKAPFWFRWVTTLIEHLFTLLLLVSLVIRYVWSHTVVPILSRFYVPFIRKRAPVSFQNDTVLITGAGGCLGRALAIEFAREARCLALLDVQKKPLDDLKQSLQQIYGKEHCRIYTYRCDLSDLNALKYTITAIREEMGDNISVLINCAATAHFKDIISHTDDEYQYTFIVNTLAPILITKDLLVGMIARNHGHIVNIVSSGALSGNAFSSSYSSSTAALLNFTETLGQELILSKVTGVRATAVLPFYLDGGIYTTLRKYGKEKVLGVTPQRFDVAAREIMNGLKSGRSPIFLPPLQLHITRFLRAVLPDDVWNPFLLHVLGRTPTFVNQH